MSEDFNFDHLSALKDHAHEHTCEWIENQKVLLKKWRKIIEERAEDDNNLFNQWSKSMMCTGFKMLEMQNESLQMIQEARLDHIDRYLKHLDSIDCTDDEDNPGQTTS